MYGDDGVEHSAQSTVIRGERCGKREVRKVEGNGSSVKKQPNLYMKQKKKVQTGEAVTLLQAF